MADLLVQRTITIAIKGPDTLVDALAMRVMTESPIMVNDHGDGKVRWSVQGRKDVLDADWNVIPPKDIGAAVRARKAESEILNLFDEMREFLDNYVDVVDGAESEPRPNRAMSLTTEIDRLSAFVRGERWPS